MDTISLINELREAIQNIKKSGQEVLSIDRLNSYLDEVQKIWESAKNNSEQEQHRIERELAHSQKQFENDMEVAKIRSAESLAMFNSVIEAGLNALKSAIIINGGAAIALLAFIGGILQKDEHTKVIEISSIGYALLVFVFGAGLSGMATGVRYLAQFLYSGALIKSYQGFDKNLERYAGHFFNSLTILMGIASYVSFFWGGWIAYCALVHR